MFKAWEDTILYPLRRCNVCKNIHQCARVTADDIAEAFFCEECYKAPLWDIVDINFTIDAGGKALNKI